MPFWQAVLPAYVAAVSLAQLLFAQQERDNSKQFGVSRKGSFAAGRGKF